MTRQCALLLTCTRAPLTLGNAELSVATTTDAECGHHCRRWN